MIPYIIAVVLIADASTREEVINASYNWGAELPAASAASAAACSHPAEASAGIPATAGAGVPAPFWATGTTTGTGNPARADSSGTRQRASARTSTNAPRWPPPA